MSIPIKNAYISEVWNFYKDPLNYAKNNDTKIEENQAQKTQLQTRISKVANKLKKSVVVVSMTGGVMAFAISAVLSSIVAIIATIAFTIAFTALFVLQLARKNYEHLPETVTNAAHAAKSVTRSLMTTTTSAVAFPVDYTLRNPSKNSPEVLAAAANPSTDIKTRPILLIHGFLHNSSGWIYQKKQLEEKGYGPIFTINLGTPFSSFEDYANKVKEQIEHIAAITKRTDITIVGHSMGGIVGTYYALNKAPKDTVKDIITLGTPFGGSYIANVALMCKCARQMLPNSDFLNKLYQQILLEKKIKFFNLSSNSDFLVVPNSSASLNLSQENISHQVFPDMEHLQYLYSDRVNDSIDCYLKKRTLDEASV